MTEPPPCAPSYRLVAFFEPPSDAIWLKNAWHHSTKRIGFSTVTGRLCEAPRLAPIDLGDGYSRHGHGPFQGAVVVPYGLMESPRRDLPDPVDQGLVASFGVIETPQLIAWEAIRVEMVFRDINPGVGSASLCPA